VCLALVAYAWRRHSIPQTAPSKAIELSVIHKELVADLECLERVNANSLVPLSVYCASLEVLGAFAAIFPAVIDEAGLSLRSDR
jgi:hypothetical protein